MDIYHAKTNDVATANFLLAQFGLDDTGGADSMEASSETSEKKKKRFSFGGRRKNVEAGIYLIVFLTNLY